MTLRRLHGLTIASAEGRWPEDSPADIRWKRLVVDELPRVARSHSAVEPRADGSWTIHFYAEPDRTHQRFAISPDGFRVESAGIPVTPDHEIWGLMAEPVMRTIFRLRGIPSFHAASLGRDNRTVLIMGDKGAGKSTLSAGLVRNGWALLSDDLCRVEQIGGKWHVHAGYNRLKLRADAASALGIAGTELEWRWRDAGSDPARLEGNKLVWKLPAPPDAGPRRIDEIFVLQRRDPVLTGATRVRLAGVSAMLALQPHLSRDPFLIDVPPRREEIAALLSLSASVVCTALTMPDGLPCLTECAAAI